MDVDEIDLKILDLLTADSRLSYSEIARHFGFSDVAIRKRVDKLIEKGVIKGFTTVCDYKKLGKEVMSFIFFKTRSDKTQEIADQLFEIPGIHEVFISLGAYDIIARCYCKDVAELKALAESRLSTLNGVLEVRPSIVFSEVVKTKE